MAKRDAHLFPESYRGSAHRKDFIFNKYKLRYEPPETFGIHRYHAICRIEKTGEDGQPCEIQESRTPASFYRLRALASTNSVGESVRPWTLSTGSGDEVLDLIIQVGLQAAEGMIALDTDANPAVTIDGVR